MSFRLAWNSLCRPRLASKSQLSYRWASQVLEWQAYHTTPSAPILNSAPRALERVSAAAAYSTGIGPSWLTELFNIFNPLSSCVQYWKCSVEVSNLMVELLFPPSVLTLCVLSILGLGWWADGYMFITVCLLNNGLLWVQLCSPKTCGNEFALVWKSHSQAIVRLRWHKCPLFLVTTFLLKVFFLIWTSTQALFWLLFACFIFSCSSGHTVIPLGIVCPSTQTLHYCFI